MRVSKQFRGFPKSRGGAKSILERANAPLYAALIFVDQYFLYCIYIV